MKDALNIVRGAVADKNLVPVLTHFHIYDGRVQGYNGALAIDTVCDGLKGIDITVPADKFLKAVSLKGEPKIEQKDGHIIVKVGKTKMKVPMAPNDSFPKVLAGQVTGETYESPKGLLSALKTVTPFISSDATRPWSMGVLLANGHAYATNNVVLVRYPVQWQKSPVGAVNLPADAVAELLRIGKEPDLVHVADNAVTFIFDSGKTWLKAQTLTHKWPDVAAMFGKVSFDELPCVPAGLEEAVENVMHFCPDLLKVVRFSEKGVSTREGQYSAEVEGYELPPASFGGENLIEVLKRADHFDASKYPGPCVFSNVDGLQGIIAGLRE